MKRVRKSNCTAWLPALLAGAAVIAPLTPAVAVGSFELPPGQNSSPRPQGPVDAGEPPPRVVRPAPTPTPAPAPVPIVTAPAAAPTVAVPTPPPSAAPRPAAQPAQPGQAPAVAPSTAPTAQPTATPSFNPLSQDRPPVIAASESPAAEPVPANSSFVLPAWWPWAAGGVALAAILGGLAFLLLRRRRERANEAPEIERPVIERPVVERPVVQRPVVAPQTAPPPPPAPAPPEDEDTGPLSIAMEAREMTISFGAATLAYRITLTNTGATPLGHVAIAGDMISAHASLSLDDQLANQQSELAPAHEIERIKPGESVQVNGEFRLPVQSIRAIRKGKAALFVPLARLRVQAGEGGNGALIRTALVGQRAANPGAGLQPFRLDLGPRIYREVTQKIF